LIRHFLEVSDESINEQVFKFLRGVWSVRRRFEGSYTGAFSGEASFQPEPEGSLAYLYAEQGELTDAEANRFDAKQSYLYRLAEGKLQVLKCDRSEWEPMHEFDFVAEDSSAVGRHIHLCGQDHYAATYRVDLTEDTWEVSYTVSGPKKDYRIHSIYTRMR